MNADIYQVVDKVALAVPGRTAEEFLRVLKLLHLHAQSCLLLIG